MSNENSNAEISDGTSFSSQRHPNDGSDLVDSGLVVKSNGDFDSKGATADDDIDTNREQTKLGATISTNTAVSSSSADSSKGRLLTILVMSLSHSNQRLNCYSECSVKDLKHQIHDEFSNHPTVEEQKLIHAGMMLQNEAKLSTVFKLHLKSEKSKKTNQDYIIHLVCNTKGSPIFKRHSPNQNNTSSNTNTTNNRNTSSTTSSSQNLTNPFVGSFSSSNQNNSTNNSMRLVSHTMSKNQYSEILLEMQSQHRNLFESLKDDIERKFYSSSAKSDNASMAHMTSVLNKRNNETVSDNGVNNTTEEDENRNAAAGSGPHVEPQDDGREAAAGGGAAAAEGGVFMNAAGFAPLAGDDPNAEENDWVSWLYSAARALILLSIIYVYSSLHRFVTVAAFTFLLYLFQRRWLPLFGRELMRRGGNDNNNNEINNDGNGEQEAAPLIPNRNEDEEVNANNNPENGESNNSDRPTERSAVETQRNISSTRNIRVRLYSALETFAVAITTFFLSLFPIELRQQNA